MAPLVRIHIHAIICSKQYLVRELWNGNKATGFIKRHDRLGRSTSLSLELENSLETTVHLITRVLIRYYSLGNAFRFPAFFPSISWIVSKSRSAHSRKIRKKRVARRRCSVHCSKLVRFVWYISFQERIEFYGGNYQNFVDHAHTSYPQSWKSWKFEAVCRLLYFGTLISSFFPQEKSWTPFKEVFSRQRRKTVLERSFHRANSRWFWWRFKKYPKYSELFVPPFVSKIVQMCTSLKKKKKTLNVIES